jgi:hypothetical protein
VIHAQEVIERLGSAAGFEIYIAQIDLDPELTCVAIELDNGWSRELDHEDALRLGSALIEAAGRLNAVLAQIAAEEDSEKRGQLT